MDLKYEATELPKKAKKPAERKENSHNTIKHAQHVKYKKTQAKIEQLN